MGFNGSGSALRQGETFLSGGGVGLPLGLCQNSPVESVSSDVLPLEEVSSPERNSTRAYQKLVWLIDMVDGKSMMNLPSWDSSQ